MLEGMVGGGGGDGQERRTVRLIDLRRQFSGVQATEKICRPSSRQTDMISKIFRQLSRETTDTK